MDGFICPSGGAVYTPSFLLPPLHPLAEPVRLGCALHDLSTPVIFLDLIRSIDHTCCDAELPTVHWRHAVSTNPVTQMSLPHPRIAHHQDWLCPGDVLPTAQASLTGSVS